MKTGSGVRIFKLTMVNNREGRLYGVIISLIVNLIVHAYNINI